MSSHVLKVAICLYPGVQLLDFAGPLDLLSVLSPAHAGIVKQQPVLFSMTQLSTEDTDVAGAGLVMHATSTYNKELASGVQYNVVLVPGGLGSSPCNTPEVLIEFLKAQYLLSVCSGTWILQLYSSSRSAAVVEAGPITIILMQWSPSTAPFRL